MSRSGFYYEPRAESALNLRLMRHIDEQFLKTPFFGSRKMCHSLVLLGHDVNRKRVTRLMRLMGLEAIYQKPRTTQANKEHVKYPYLLRDLAIVRPDQVWATDITYIPLRRGFLFLVAVIDWFSRYVLSWELSNTLDAQFCVTALNTALAQARPEIFNSDQGSQFTSSAFIDRLKQAEVAISMDGKGRAFDNIIVERFWRSVKYEDVYIHNYESGTETHTGIATYMNFFNRERPHQSLGNRTPAEVYFNKQRPAFTSSVAA